MLKHRKLQLAIAAAAIGLVGAIAACAGLGDKAADTLLGPDCGPESRVFRAELLTERITARFPTAPVQELNLALAGMRAAAEAGQDMGPSALAYQAALAFAVGPAIGASEGQPVLMRLSLLPGAAEDFLVIRARLAAFCTQQAS